MKNNNKNVRPSFYQQYLTIQSIFYFLWQTSLFLDNLSLVIIPLLFSNVHTQVTKNTSHETSTTSTSCDPMASINIKFRTSVCKNLPCADKKFGISVWHHSDVQCLR